MLSIVKNITFSKSPKMIDQIVAKQSCNNTVLKLAPQVWLHNLFKHMFATLLLGLGSLKIPADVFPTLTTLLFPNLHDTSLLRRSTLVMYSIRTKKPIEMWNQSHIFHFSKFSDTILFQFSNWKFNYRILISVTIFVFVIHLLRQSENLATHWF